MFMRAMRPHAICAGRYRSLEENESNKKQMV